MFDDEKRIYAMTNMVNIIKATGGKNLIISSHAGQSGQSRTPFDVAALMISLGLDKNKALSCMKDAPEELIKNAQHRQFMKGTIRQIPASIGKKIGKRIKKHR